MDAEKINLTVAGLPLSIRPGADVARISVAAALVDRRLADQMNRSRGRQGKDVQLTFVALGLADELLQLQKQQADMQARMEALLSQINQSDIDTCDPLGSA